MAMSTPSSPRSEPDTVLVPPNQNAIGSLPANSSPPPLMQDSSGPVAPLAQPAHCRANNRWGNAAAANIAEWGSPANHGWGDDLEVTERTLAADRLREQCPTPRITSLAAPGNGWGGDGSVPALFHWHASDASGKPSDRHIAQYARMDMSKVYAPGKQSILDNTPTEPWAHTQVIRSTPEAQRSGIPGPTFTLTQVTDRLNEVNNVIAARKAQVAANMAKLDAIREQQEPLHRQLHELDQVRNAVHDNNREIEEERKRLDVVLRDLKDLEALALTFG
ncbi:hypothetical protein V5O48_015661 [Marasmius crinis-equi]|uniref:Uncharacterized protein n=1 Tax=Marasmius crinis-equi TaxID=585013 RepID=A0ABR3ETY2_9AGAR